MKAHRPRHLLLGGTLLAALAGPACGSSSATPSAPKAHTEGPRSLPALDPGAIVFAMGGHETEFRKCFFRNPRDRGTLRVRWLADERGFAQNPEVVHSTLTTESIERCLLDRVADLRFGRLQEPAQGEWVFVFRLAEPRRTADAPKDVKTESQEEEPEEEGTRLDGSSHGRLEPDRVDSVIQAGYRLYARCYRSGLKRQEELAGVLRFRFVIGEAGRIETVQDEGSNMPDPFAVDCVAEAFYALEFPRPQSGPVTVQYRMRLN